MVPWQGTHRAVSPRLLQLWLLWIIKYSFGNLVVMALIAFVFSRSTNSDLLKIIIIVTEKGKQHILKHFSRKDIVPVQSEMKHSEGITS